MLSRYGTSVPRCMSQHTNEEQFTRLAMQALPKESMQCFNNKEIGGATNKTALHRPLKRLARKRPWRKNKWRPLQYTSLRLSWHFLHEDSKLVFYHTPRHTCCIHCGCEDRLKLRSQQQRSRTFIRIAGSRTPHRCTALSAQVHLRLFGYAKRSSTQM